MHSCTYLMCVHLCVHAVYLPCTFNVSGCSCVRPGCRDPSYGYVGINIVPLMLSRVHSSSVPHEISNARTALGVALGNDGRSVGLPIKSESLSRDLSKSFERSASLSGLLFHEPS